MTRRLVDSVIEKAQLFVDVTGAGTMLPTFNGIDAGCRYLLSGNQTVFLGCDKGRALVSDKIVPVFEAEGRALETIGMQNVREFLRISKLYCAALRECLQAVK